MEPLVRRCCALAVSSGALPKKFSLSVYGSCRLMSNGGRQGRKTSGKKHSQSSSSQWWLRRQSKDLFAERARKEGRPSRAYYKLEQIDELMQKQGRAKSSSQRRKRGDDEGGLFRSGDIAIDLGAAPGGWSVYASKKIGPSGKLVAVDLLPLDSKTMHSLENDESMADFYFARADFNSFMTKEFISEAISEGSDNQLQCRADVIMSDMAANFTGNKSTDALRTLSLCENALQFAAGTSCFDDPPDPHAQYNEELPPKSWQDGGLLRVGGSFLCKYFQCGKENERMLLDTAKNRFEDVRILKPMASRKESSERYLLARKYKG